MIGEASAWAFGWEALVAIGTLGLGAATTWLAINTRSVARETRDLAIQTSADVQAQWRPLIVPDQNKPPSVNTKGLPEGMTPYVLVVSIWNAGRGPALFVRIQHDPSGNSPDNWSLGSLSQGERVSLRIQGVAHLAMSQLLIDYRDLAGRSYSTAIVLDHSVPDTPGRYYDVRFAEGERFTTHGESVSQPGLRKVGLGS